MKIAAPVHEQPSTPPDWVDVLTDLRGLRLAVYDELLRTAERSELQLIASLGSPEEPQPTRREAQTEGAVARALAWLGHHRLAVRGTNGRWMPRALRPASEQFLKSGPDAAYPLLAPAPALAVEKDHGDRRSQDQVVRAEGAGASTPTHARRPALAVHTPQFFDFGDY